MDMSFGIVPPNNSNKNTEVKNTEKNNRDMVKHPNHYNSKSMECKEIIAVMVEGLEGEDAFFMGNAIKYLYRFSDKGTPEQDLRKAKQYIDFMLEKY